jgi:hypothetical protein
MAEFRYSVSTIIAGKYESLGPVKEIDDAEKIAPVILDGCGPADVFVKLGNRIVDSFVVTSKGIVRNGKLRKVRTCSDNGQWTCARCNYKTDLGDKVCPDCNEGIMQGSFEQIAADLKAGKFNL